MGYYFNKYDLDSSLGIMVGNKTKDVTEYLQYNFWMLNVKCFKDIILMKVMLKNGI